MTAEEARVLVLYTGGTIGMLKPEAGGGYAPHPGFLASNLRAQARFHDPKGQSVWTNSTSIEAFSQWSEQRTASGRSAAMQPAESTSSAIQVLTSTGPLLLPSLVTPRFAQGKRIRYAVWEYARLIDSSEIEPQDFLTIAADIERNYSHFDAFLVLHGTDTMAFSAAALSFVLENLGKPVILTGAQIPLSELFTDAIDNLLGSLIIAGHFAIPEVCLFFDNKLFRGNRAIKFSSEDFHAFQSPNLAPLATVGIDVDVAWGQVLRPGPRPFRAHRAFSSDVATLRIFPGVTSQAVRAFLRPGGVRGVVIESYGAGNAPRRPELLKAFKEATEQGIVIVNVTQCVTGSVAPDIYETGRALAAVGVAGGGDMTTEAALAKLSYLLSKPELSPAQIRKLVSQPLRGELTPVSPIPTFSSPTSAADTRLQTLFSQIIELAPSPRRGMVSPTHKTVPLPDAAALDVPDEFTAQPTLADEEALKAAITPYLLAQAASRHDSTFASLLSSLDSPPLAAVQTHTSTSSAPLALPSILNESAIPTLQTPLHLAVLAGNPANVDLLLSAGASVHTRDTFAHSPLFYAARHGDVHGAKMVRSLRAAGAHLGESEIESGTVGLEVLKAEKAGDSDAMAVWRDAAGEEDYTRAKEVARAALS